MSSVQMLKTIDCCIEILFFLWRTSVFSFVFNTVGNSSSKVNKIFDLGWYIFASYCLKKEKPGPCYC